MRTSQQLWRYGLVGLASNATLYLIYLGLTHLGLAPIAAMSASYALGVALTFPANKAWTFRDRGPSGNVAVRYGAAHATGYLTNLAVLSLCVTALGWPHAWVQAGAIGLVALLLFLLQKHWVFRDRRTASS
jgi:putative flippase GtrA